MVAGLLTATPLLHFCFLPDLTHINFLPLSITELPALGHAAPGLGFAALAVFSKPIVTRASKVSEMVTDRSGRCTPED